MECKTHTSRYKGKRFTVIDTPGLADRNTAEQNFEVLQQIAHQLRNMGQDHVSGVIYFHSIENTRIQGSDMANFRILRAICGEAFFPRVAFITTRWDRIKWDQTVENRNQALENERRKLLPTGPKIFKFLNDGESHRSVLDYFFSLPMPPNTQLRFTQELKLYRWDRKLDKAVKKTGAGKEVAAHSKKVRRGICSFL